MRDPLCAGAAALRGALLVLCLAAGLTAQPPTLVVPKIVDGKCEPIEEFRARESWIQEEVFVLTSFDSDGNGAMDRMHVVITRPRAAEEAGIKLPVIYETSPYYSGTGSTDTSYFWNPRHELGATPPARPEMPPIPHRADQTVLSRSLTRTWIPRGFAVVHSASPGTGRSQGCPTMGGENEALAPKAVIDWLNGRTKGFRTLEGSEEVVASWCNGKVGMIGTSFNGTLPVAAATTGVEGLKTIVPVAPNTSYYHYYRSNGLVRHPGGYMGEDIDVLFDFVNSGAPAAREYCLTKVRRELLEANLDRVTGDYSDFWAGRDYALQMDKWKVPALLAHAFNDWNVMPEHTARVLAELRKREIPTIVYWHQDGHGGDPPMDLLNRWFTRWLYDVENGVENGPKAFIVRERGRQDQPTPYPNWPHPDAAQVVLVPTGAGKGLGLLAPGSPEQSEQTLIDDVNVPGAQLAMAEASDHRLLFATPPLKEPLHLSGTARFTIRMSSSKQAANLSVWLVALPWTERARHITDNVVTRGWADPQNHASIRKGVPLEPGRFYEFSFELQPDDQIIPAGERLALMIFSSDQDFTLWPEPGTKLTVDLAKTQLELPVVGGQAAFESATRPD